VFTKYRRLSDDLVILRADILALERQRGFLHRLQELRAEIRGLAVDLGRLQADIEADVERQNGDAQSRFSAIRLFFSEIVEEVISRQALLKVYPNKEGHLEFKAEILDVAGNSTSADDGHSYRKLLCIAFDLAVLRAHIDQKFPRFVFHDGVFEALDRRKKENLLAVFRRYAEMGFQLIITLIDSDQPERSDSDEPVFAQDEIVLRLHDQDQTGRLFKMRAW
jgi:uncharacterized protein YydD (DUF2326 family)